MSAGDDFMHAHVSKDPSDETIVEADQEQKPEPELGHVDQPSEAGAPPVKHQEQKPEPELRHVDQPVEADAPPVEHQEPTRQPIIEKTSKIVSSGTNSVANPPHVSGSNPKKRNRQETSSNPPYELQEHTTQDAAGKRIACITFRSRPGTRSYTLCIRLLRISISTASPKW